MRDLVHLFQIRTGPLCPRCVYLLYNTQATSFPSAPGVKNALPAPRPYDPASAVPVDPGKQRSRYGDGIRSRNSR